jgi:hypothetical protein
MVIYPIGLIRIRAEGGIVRWYDCPHKEKRMTLWPWKKKKIKKAAHAALLELALEGIHYEHNNGDDSCYLDALKNMSEGIIEKRCAECYLTRSKYERFMQ